MQALYPNRRSYELAVYDIHIPGAAELLHRERAPWQKLCDIKAIDKNHLVLVVYAGGVRRLAS